GTENTSNYFRALQLFERSRRLSLNAHAPSFNAAIVRRKLKLDESADGTDHVQSESELLNSLHDALHSNSPANANQLLQKDLSLYRSAAVHRALSPDSGAV